MSSSSAAGGNQEVDCKLIASVWQQRWWTNACFMQKLSERSRIKLLQQFGIILQWKRENALLTLADEILDILDDQMLQTSHNQEEEEEKEKEKEEKKDAAADIKRLVRSHVVALQTALLADSSQRPPADCLSVLPVIHCIYKMLDQHSLEMQLDASLLLQHVVVEKESSLSPDIHRDLWMHVWQVCVLRREIIQIGIRWISKRWAEIMIDRHEHCSFLPLTQLEWRSIAHFSCGTADASLNCSIVSDSTCFGIGARSHQQQNQRCRLTPGTFSVVSREEHETGDGCVAINPMSIRQRSVAMGPAVAKQCRESLQEVYREWISIYKDLKLRREQGMSLLLLPSAS